MHKILKTAAFCAAALFIAPTTQAQDFPQASRPIKIIVPYTAGGSSDYLARIVAKKMSENMKHNVIVDNRPGGSTVIGGDFVAKSKPDGYTVYLIGELTNASLVPLHKSLPYDPVSAFSGISNLIYSPLVISVPPDFPAKNLKEFVDYAKAHPGKINYGSAGQGNTLHLAGEQFADTVKVKLTHVPYKGASQALVDLVAGRIQVMFDLPQTPLPQIKEGKLRALAVTSRERLDLLPDVPTTDEAGFPNYHFTTRVGLAAPAGTPAAVLEKLNAEVKKVMADPEVKKSLSDRGMYVATSATPQDYDKDIKNAVQTVTTLLRNAGVQAQ